MVLVVLVEVDLAGVVAGQDAEAGEGMMRDDEMSLAAQAFLDESLLGGERNMRQIIDAGNPGESLQHDAMHDGIAAEEG